MSGSYAVFVKLLGCFLSLGLAYWARTASAAQIDCLREVRGSCDSILIKGQIEKGDYERFLTLFRQSTNRSAFGVYLQSNGGVADDAMKIGRLLRKYLVSVKAPWQHRGSFILKGLKKEGYGEICQGPTCNCASACALIWLGSVDRWGTVGLHRPKIIDPQFARLPLGEARTIYNKVLQDVALYLEEMEVPRPLIETMVATSTVDIHWISADEDNYRLQHPPSFVEWVNANCGPSLTVEERRIFEDLYWKDYKYKSGKYVPQSQKLTMAEAAQYGQLDHKMVDHDFCRGRLVQAERTREPEKVVAAPPSAAKAASPPQAKPAVDVPFAPTPPPGTVFRDCPDCPEMVVVPAGEFTMGSTSAEIAAATKEFDNDWPKLEGPQRKVTIARSFAVGKFEVTFAEWEACVAGGGCASDSSPNDAGWGRGRRPVINVSWNDAKEYVAWLSLKTGKTYRLLSEAEWEYAARAGTETRYSWGNEIGGNRANCFGCESQWDLKQTGPVGSFTANAFGLHDMHGNVRELVEDCWHYSYQGAPTDGSAWTTSCADSGRVVRGGNWADDLQFVRAAARSWVPPDYRAKFQGFRLTRPVYP